MARLVLILMIAFVAEASPVRTCPSICFCRHTKADCRDIPEWDLKASDAQVVRIIPPLHPVPPTPLFLSRLDMFPKVQMLSVTNRSIVELTSGNLPTLQVLDLSHNKIGRFNERTFHHMPVLRQLNLAGNPISLKRGIPFLISSSIRTLDLGYSGLSYIPNGSLGGIPNLTSLYLQGNHLKLQEGVPLVDRISIQELDLSYCKLTKIPPHTLDNLVNLQRLYLKGNDLKTILVATLPFNLHHLDLSANKIREVPLAALSALKNLTNLELAKNPVKCTCDLISFLDRLSEQNVISEKMIVCAEPDKYSKIPWKDIDERELCKDDITSEEAASDDDSSYTSERDSSYETDGPPDEENRIMSQHPPPLSLQNLLQKPTRYQNMEENSIQSDQPYSNTSDMNDSPATTAETDLQKDSDETLDDDLIVSSGAEPEYDAPKDTSTSTDSYDVSSKENSDTKVSKGTKEHDDSLIVPVSPLHEDDEDDGKLSTSIDSRKVSPDANEMASLEATSLENEDSHISRDRENLEDEKEQEEDLVKVPVPDASLAAEDQTGTQKPTETTTTEDPDSETFMKNEETIAMGKMMPESKSKQKDDTLLPSDENISQDPTLLASLLRSEGQAEKQPSLESVPAASSTDEKLLNRNLEAFSDEVTEKEQEVTTDTLGHDQEVTPMHSNHATEKPSSLDRDQKIQRNSFDAETSSEKSEEHTESLLQTNVEKKAGNSETTENGLESVESEPYPSTETSGEMGVDIESTQTHSDNETEHAQAATPEYESLNENGTPGINVDKTEAHQRLSEDALDHVGENGQRHEATDESELATTEASFTPDPSVNHDKGVSEAISSSSSNRFEDIDAQMASLFPDTPSTTERRETPPVETTTPLVPETSTYHVTENENNQGLGSFFPFSLIPKPSEDKAPSAVSESEGFLSETSRSEDLTVENNLARVSSDSEKEDEDDVGTATIAYVVIAGVIVCIIIGVACVSLRTRSDKKPKKKGSAPVRIRGDNVSPGTEMKDMMNPLLEPIANEFHDDPTRRSSLVSIDLKFPKENGGVSTPNGELSQDSSFKPISVDQLDNVTQVVIEATPSNGTAGSPTSAPVNGKPPTQNGTAGTANKVKVVAGVIPPAIPRTPVPVYVKKGLSDS